MTIYPVEFHRRLEQKWASRIGQILAVTGTAPPPRDADTLATATSVTAPMSGGMGQ
jgi:hypothetical protein